MIFHPENIAKLSGAFYFFGNVFAKANSCLNKDVIRDFWRGYSCHMSEIEISEDDGFSFTVGCAELLALDGHSYTINVTPTGASVFAKSENDLLLGFMTLLDRIKPTDENGRSELKIECCRIKETPLIKNRMVHFCVFPETELWEVRKFLRFCGALKISHVVLEFWGMLRYDCMPELSWEQAFSKKELRPIIREARELGVEIVPMFNHWGHAAASRAIHGKHVVIDQKPELAILFSENGWCWNFEKPRVKALLKSIREELIELCGDGSYFHIGCDEADGYEFSEENNRSICKFLNEISEELSRCGRRAIVWGDMFLSHHREYDLKNRYICHAPNIETERYFLSNLDKRIVIADWQYHPIEAPIETSLTFKNAGFDCLICPWDESRETLDSCVRTLKEYGLFGFIHTTWNTLSIGIKYIPTIAMGAFEDISKRTENPIYNSAYVMRRANFAAGNYTMAGWTKKQVDDRT